MLRSYCKQFFTFVKFVFSSLNVFIRSFHFYLFSSPANNNALPACHQTPSPLSGHDDFVLVPANLPEDPMANSPRHPSSQQQQQQQQRPRSGPSPGSGGVGVRTPVRRIGSKEMLAAAAGHATASSQGSPQTPTMLRRTHRVSTGGLSNSPSTPSPPAQKQSSPASSSPSAGVRTEMVRPRSSGAISPFDSQPIPVPSQVEAFKQMESQHGSQQQPRRPSSVNSVSGSIRRSLISPTPSTPPPLPSSKPPALPQPIVLTPSPDAAPVHFDPPNVQFFLGAPPVATGGRLRRHSNNFGSGTNLASNAVGSSHPNSAPTLRRSGRRF